MFKKEVARGRSWNTRGQITLFIIVGLVILFSFLMVIQLTDSVAKGKLKQEQEKVMSGGFRKEALRLFVEACLEKSLERGLILIGQQGTIWSDQPGGTKGFAPGVTGVEDPETGTKVAYGITQRKYTNPSWSPCNGDGGASCTYIYPNTTVRFGTLSLTDVTEDLRLYLKEETYACVNDFVEREISSSAVVEREELDLQLEMRNDGISIRANYPLKFSLSGEDFFYLSRFDFFYRTDFKKFYRSAVEFPFQQDYNFVDYNFEQYIDDGEFEYASERTRDIIPGMLTPLCRDNPGIAETFWCRRTTFALTYQDLNTQVTVKPVGADDIFEYTVPEGIIKKPYTFRMARQNRPPALDYVSRKECPAFGYDYLVIKGKDNLKTVDTTLLAHDPDEGDTLTYSFSSTDIPLAATTSDRLVIGEDVILPLDPKIYTITATAKDPHNVPSSSDSQDIKVLVDNELSTTLSFDFPYNDVQSLHGTTYYISKEDPIFLKLKFPQPRFNGDVGTATLTKNDGTAWNFVLLPSGPQLQRELSYPLPLDPEREDPTPGTDFLTTYYNQPSDINNINRFQTNPFVVSGSRLDLTLDYEFKYCGLEEQKQTSTSSAITYVVDCVPHRNAEAKSYPYNGDTNAFLADHTCCVGQPENPATWNIAADGTTCYINPSLGCYGTMVGSGKYVAAYEGYVLEKQFGVCDGISGNTCKNKKGEFVDGPLLCGGIGDPSCKTSGTNPINSNCYDQSAWGLVADPDGADSKLPGWCYGTMGCTQFCSLEQGGSIVQVDEIIPTPKDNALNTYVKQNFVQDLNRKLDCGCKREYLGKKCDAGFDGEFEGTCQPEGGTYKCKI